MVEQIIKRSIESSILQYLQKGKVIILLGARRVGKTFLINRILEKYKEKYLLLNGELYTTSDLLERKSVTQYSELIGDNSLLVIDEAQKINDIGRILKIIVDEIKNVKILVTGSSAFDLSGKLGEPLTGRKYTFYLYPFAQCELKRYENQAETVSNLESRLIYGGYPEIINLKGTNQKISYIYELVNSYLLKELLTFEGIRNSNKLLQILRLLAFQVGSQVSLVELGSAVGLNKNTIDKYLDLLEKVFVIFKVGGFSRNLRKEISKSYKYFFYDNGIRNAIIDNFHPLSLRNDIGQLWENYVISERLKFLSYEGVHSYKYFWRTYDKQEIDWIEEREGKLFAFEIKYKKAKLKIPKAWNIAYPDSEFRVIDSENYLKFIS